MKTQAIIPTAGLGTRMGADYPKPLMAIRDKPMIVRTLEAFEHCELIDSVIVVANEKTIDEFSSMFKSAALNKVKKVILGGAERSDSVSNGLKALDSNTELVVVHDGARPLIKTEYIEQAIIAGKSDDAVVVGVPVKSTVKVVRGNPPYVEATLDRSTLWEIQTPQVFKKDVLINAHQQKSEEVATDDAMLVEKMGVKVRVIEGDYRNIKVTTKEDLVLAEVFLASE